MKKNFNIILLAITIILILFTAYNVIQKNRTENKVINLEKEIEEIEQEKETVQELEEENEDHTFEDDINWFVTEVYTLENRKVLYEKIEQSATEDVLIGLFGEELPPDENQGEVHSIDRKVDDIEIYGKYQDEKHYQGIVTFNLSFEDEERSESAFTVLQVDLTKKEDGWKISEFEEYAKGGRQ